MPFIDKIIAAIQALDTPREGGVGLPFGIGPEYRLKLPSVTSLEDVLVGRANTMKPMKKVIK